MPGGMTAGFTRPARSCCRSRWCGWALVWTAFCRTPPTSRNRLPTEAVRHDAVQTSAGSPAAAVQLPAIFHVYRRQCGAVYGAVAAGPTGVAALSGDAVRLGAVA